MVPNGVVTARLHAPHGDDNQNNLKFIFLVDYRFAVRLIDSNIDIIKKV